jgi:hypothetical protein
MCKETHNSRGRVGSHAKAITEALLTARPKWRTERELVDDLLVTALYAEHGDQTVCLLAYDVCEIPRDEAICLKKAVGERLGIRPDHVHVFCSHTHSSSMNRSEHDLPMVMDLSAQAAANAREAARDVSAVDFLRVDTQGQYSINRRTKTGHPGAWCLMQSQGCSDDGTHVDGTDWAKGRLRQYGATEEAISGLEGPFLATGDIDPYLDLVLFPSEAGGYAGGLVRFTAHAVICSAGYWKPNLGRDFPGQLCDRLAEKFGCPILFLQGPCANHRPRHREVGLEERDRIGRGLAEELIQKADQLRRFPFDRLGNAEQTLSMPLSRHFPASQEVAAQQIQEAESRLNALPQTADSLAERKRLAEEISFCRNCLAVLDGKSYLTPKEAADRQTSFTLSHVQFGDVHLLNYPGELFATVTTGMENATGGPIVVTSFADGVTGYLMEEKERVKGGYESTWALFSPECISGLRDAGLALLAE